MANLRMNQNLQPQVQLSAAKKVKVKANENDGVTLEESVKLVKDGKADPNEVLANLGVKNAQVKNFGKNRQNLTFEVNGKRISVTGTSPEKLAAKAGELLAEELGNGQNDGPEKSIGASLIVGTYWLICLIILLITLHRDKKKKLAN